MKSKLLSLAMLLVAVEPSIYGSCSAAFGGKMKPEEIVEAQLDAYNKKDVEGCLSYYADDVQVFLLPEGKALFNNKQEIRANVEQSIQSGEFEESVLVEKIAGGKFVTLVEQKGSRKAIFHYYVGSSGLIEKAWVSPIE